MPASFFSALRNLSARLLAVGTICTCTTSLTHAQITVTRDKGGFNFTAYDGPAPQSTGVIMIPTHTFVGIGGEERLNIDWLAINIRWGILFGEIVEDYAVEWASHPNIPFVAMTEGQRMAYRREEFAFYHDLVARIAQLRPKAIEFVITFSVADAGGKIHRGSTLVPAVMTLFARSGERPFHVPSIRPAGNFLQDGPLKNDYPDILKVLPSARSLTIESVTITRLEWPVSEMRAILAQRAAYLKEPHDEKTEDLIEEEWAKAEDQAAAQAAADEKKHAELEVLRASQENELTVKNQGRLVEPQTPAAVTQVVGAKPPAKQSSSEVSKTDELPDTSALSEPAKADDGLHYYRLPNGQLAFKQGFHEAHSFKGEFAWVNLGQAANGEWQHNVINRKGEYMLPQHYNSVELIDGRFAVVGNYRPDKRDQRYGFIELKTKRWILPFEYHHVRLYGNESISKLETEMYANYSAPFRKVRHWLDAGHTILFVDADVTSVVYDFDKASVQLKKVSERTSRWSHSIRDLLGLDEQRQARD